MSWNYVCNLEFLFIRLKFVLLQFKTLKVEEYRLTLKNLEQHYQIFMRDSQDSELFGADERMQAESAFNNATQHYDNLQRSVEQGEKRI